MKKRRKTEKCLNCGFSLDPKYEYCPVCGQENTDNQLSFGQLLSDFFSNYFSLDSRFGRSFKPFFLRPGILTHEFIEGHRVKYANPIRLYLVVSLVHFFLLSIYSGMGDAPEKKGFIQVNPEKKDLQAKEPVNTDEVVLGTSDEDFFINGKTIGLIRDLSDDYTVDEILDSLQIQGKSYFQQLTLRQLVKLEKSGSTSLQAYILKNIPILMFFLLPIYALILKVFFPKPLYINHVVHSLHIHSFTFIVLSIYWLYGIISEPGVLIQNIAFLLVMLYIVTSFTNTYAISKVKAFFTMAFSGVVYTIVLSIALFITFIISFFTF